MARDVALQLLKDNLVKAKDIMKKMADIHRSERNFPEGDMVFLRLQPYRYEWQAEDLISFLLSSMVHIK